MSNEPPRSKLQAINKLKPGEGKFFPRPFRHEKFPKEHNLALIVIKFMIENRLVNFHAIDKINIGDINE